MNWRVVKYVVGIFLLRILLKCLCPKSTFPCCFSTELLGFQSMIALANYFRMGLHLEQIIWSGGHGLIHSYVNWHQMSSSLLKSIIGDLCCSIWNVQLVAGLRIWCRALAISIQARVMLSSGTIFLQRSFRCLNAWHGTAKGVHAESIEGYIMCHKWGCLRNSFGSEDGSETSEPLFWLYHTSLKTSFLVSSTLDLRCWSC